VTPDFVIPVLGRSWYDAGADVIALAAYPTDENRRALFTRAVLATQIQYMLQHDPNWEPGISPSRYTALPFEDFEKNYRLGLHQIDDRFSAGKAAIPFVQEAIANRRGKRVRLLGGQALSKQEIFARISAQVGEKKERSLATVWDNSWPVIHLSIALTYATPHGSEVTISQLLNLSPLKTLKCANYLRALLRLGARPAPKRGPHSRPNFTDPGIYRVMWR
jgi:hypothetical protein